MKTNIAANPAKAPSQKGHPIKHTLSDKIFLAINWIVLSAFLLIIAYPLIFVVTASFSSGTSIMSLSLLPQNPSLVGYETVFKYKDIWTGYGNSLIYMVCGTAISLVVTVMCAYPLSRPDFKGRGFIMAMCMVTMYFSGGLIPTYLTIRSLGLLQTRWSVILPGAMSVYNMIVMRTYMRNSIPLELLECSQLDGCGNIRYLMSIVLPLSGPILAVIGLYYAVGHWNAYFDAMIYLSGSREYYPLSLILREILVQNDSNIDQMDIETLMAIEERRNIMKYAVIIVSCLPVMILYPFVQKYFVKGVMIGAVKG